MLETHRNRMMKLSSNNVSDALTALGPSELDLFGRGVPK